MEKSGIWIFVFRVFRLVFDFYFFLVFRYLKSVGYGKGLYIGEIDIWENFKLI